MRNPTLSARSIKLDNDYLRGYRSRMEANGFYSEMFERFGQAAKICASANTLVDDEISVLFPKSHGQLLQDVVCALLHKGKRDGYFVEIGVGDGTRYSNTRLLEKELGWRGILAEPAQMFHDRIANSRTAILDRRAVGSETGNTLTFEQDDSMGELSGLAGERTAHGGQNLSTYKVDTVRLHDLLDEHGAPDRIDYISIDTEGSELSVLSGLSLKKRRVTFFTIEHNFDTYRMKKYDEILLGAGYTRILTHISGFDYWYVDREFEQEVFSGDC
ncbi:MULTISPECIES: FkbM family methyltransferase [unclassified Aurantimonas]|uniref:FkbM family methyltransferase n=1 Tax=unclassified Aurantimonas TaxID=2638230 RepID=UPI002E17C235|nr:MULTISPECIES: FkbM family methyltransferase [unclassified Aurantimonas]MEC5293427.1 FkbM family methyltransferase [Aurantimonas sp. C2-3-R2]MEC5414514.1 FkbM family methyltransferase [Aurantimonas sp. C2-4-R8]